MNKKGFTLVELLAVIALIAILSGMAVPNVMSSINNSKKNSFLVDSRRMISKAENLVATNSTIRASIKNGTAKTFTLQELNINGEFLKDADGGEYDSSSFINVKYQGNSYVFCVCIKGSLRHITGSNKTCNVSNTSVGTGCLLSTFLKGIDVVVDN